MKTTDFHLGGTTVRRLLLHDLRANSCAQHDSGGSPGEVAMLISGHRTRSVFERYNIMDDRDFQRAGDKMAEYLSSQGPEVTADQVKAETTSNDLKELAGATRRDRTGDLLITKQFMFGKLLITTNTERTVERP